jgi:hypothetical protein
MKQSSIHIDPEDSEPADEIAGVGPTVVHITNYYAGSDKQKAHNDFVRGGTDASVVY